MKAIQLSWSTWGAVCDLIGSPWFVVGCYLDKDNNEYTYYDNMYASRLGLKYRTDDGRKILIEQGDWIAKDLNCVEGVKVFKLSLYCERY